MNKYIEMQKQKKTHQRNPHQHKNEPHDVYRRRKTMQKIVMDAREHLRQMKLKGRHEIPVTSDMVRKLGIRMPTIVCTNTVTGETTTCEAPLSLFRMEVC